MPDLVPAVNKHGEKQYVPPHFLELSAAGVPGFEFKLPPSVRAQETTKATVKAATDKEKTDA